MKAFNQETERWDRLVNEKPPNLMGNWGEKPTFWKRPALNKSLCSTTCDKL